MKKIYKGFGIIIILIIFLISAFNNLNSNNDLKNSNIDRSILNISKSPDIFFYDNDKKIQIEKIKETVNNFFINGYRNHNMQCKENEKLHEGENVYYNVYYVGKNLLFAKFLDKEDQEFNYNFSYFKIISSTSLQQEGITDKDLLDSIWNAKDLLYVYSGNFIVNSNNYDDFNGKEKMKEELEESIKYRYFDFSEKKSPSDNPIFYETDKTRKVYLLDFDDKSSYYSILVFTDNGYVYAANIEYVGTNNDHYIYQINETEKYKYDDINNYDEASNSDNQLSIFINFYKYTLNHIISTISENELG